MLRLAAAAIAATEPVDDDGQRGLIVNTASVAAFDGQIGQVAYAASKGGVAGMTLPAARDLAQYGIRVMTIAPGILDTPMMAGDHRGVPDHAGRRRAVPARGSAGPTSTPRWCWRSPRLDYLNGEVIRLDGALRMAPR